MENMDKGLTVPKWVLINESKIPKIFLTRLVCPSPNVWDFRKKLSLGVLSPWCTRSNYCTWTMKYFKLLGDANFNCLKALIYGFIKPVISHKLFKQGKHFSIWLIWPAFCHGVFSRECRKSILVRIFLWNFQFYVNLKFDS